MIDSSWTPWIPAVGSPSSVSRVPLDGATSADVLVVGAGVVGLAAAIELADRGATVVVLEAGEIGNGASGRNAGHLSSAPGAAAVQLVRRHGERAAREAIAIGVSGVDAVEHLIERFGIDARYRPHGNLTVALHGAELDGLRAEAELLCSLGGPVRMVERGELVARRILGGFAGAIEHLRGGVLDPGAYTRGLADAAIGLGVRVLTRTPVLGLSAGAPMVATTPAGSVRARRVVLATGSFPTVVRAARRRVVPVRVRCLMSAPLGAGQWEELGWSGGEGLATTHPITENYRRTDDGRVVAGTRLVAYRAGSARSVADDARLDGAVEAACRRRFPALAEMAVEHRWGGWVDMSVDGLPSLARFGEGGALLVADGFSGHGLAAGTAVGQRLADAALDDVAAGPFLGRRTRRWPVEPVRWIGARATIATLDRRNRTHDRAAGRPSTSVTPVPPQGLEP